MLKLITSYKFQLFQEKQNASVFTKRPIMNNNNNNNNDNLYPHYL